MSLFGAYFGFKSQAELEKYACIGLADRFKVTPGRVKADLEYEYGFAERYRLIDSDDEGEGEYISSRSIQRRFESYALRGREIAHPEHYAALAKEKQSRDAEEKRIADEKRLVEENQRLEELALANMVAHRKRELERLIARHLAEFNRKKASRAKRLAKEERKRAREEK